MKRGIEAPVVEARQLVKHFHPRRSWFNRNASKVRAVDGISFEIAAGKTLALVGESGCGKSTTARLLLQLLQPDSGEILLDGNPATEATPQFMRAVQMVFQDPYASLTPHFRVRSLLSEPLAIHNVCPAGERRDYVEAAVAAVGLSSDVLSRYPHELSGGQRQRIGIARALSVDPKLIVCDEPVSALDVSIRAQIINLLLELQDNRNLAYLFISHDLELVAHVSDVVAVMYLGKIVERAPTEQFFARLQHPYSKALLASSLVPDPGKRTMFSPLGGEAAQSSELLGGCSFRNRCPVAIGKCATEEPVLRATGEGHHVACHLVE